jgi:hypothetical protein
MKSKYTYITKKLRFLTKLGFIHYFVLGHDESLVIVPLLSADGDIHHGVKSPGDFQDKPLRQNLGLLVENGFMKKPGEWFLRRGLTRIFAPDNSRCTIAGAGDHHIRLLFLDGREFPRAVSLHVHLGPLGWAGNGFVTKHDDLFFMRQNDNMICIQKIIFFVFSLFVLMTITCYSSAVLPGSSTEANFFVDLISLFKSFRE